MSPRRMTASFHLAQFHKAMASDNSITPFSTQLFNAGITYLHPKCIKSELSSYLPFSFQQFHSISKFKMPVPPNTAIILIDPYNDFLHPDGKLNGLLKDSIKETDTITHLKELVATAREKNLSIFYGLHQQMKPGFIAGWKHATLLQQSQFQNNAFAEYVEI